MYRFDYYNTLMLKRPLSAYVIHVSGVSVTSDLTVVNNVNYPQYNARMILHPMI